MMSPSDLVALWQDRLAIIARNMNELGSAEFTLRARNQLRNGTYMGATRACAAAAIDQLSALNDQYVLLVHVVEEAIRANKDGFFVIPEKREARVRELLAGASIERPLGMVAVQTRDLLGGSQNTQKLTPEQLLVTMQDQFREARDALDAIDKADTQNRSDMAALKSDFAELQQRALTLGWAGDHPVLIDPQLAARDPLKYANAIAALNRALAIWAVELNALADRQVSTREEADRAINRLAELKHLVARRQKAQTEAVTLFGGVVVPDANTSLDMLEGWQSSITKALQAGNMRAAEVGLARFNAAIEHVHATESKSLADLQAPVRAYQDLAGQFQALKAKARVLDIAAPEEAAIGRALSLRPADLAALTQLVRRFQHQLSAGKPSALSPSDTGKTP